MIQSRYIRGKERITMICGRNLELIQSRNSIVTSGEASYVALCKSFNFSENQEKLEKLKIEKEQREQLEKLKIEREREQFEKLEKAKMEQEKIKQDKEILEKLEKARIERENLEKLEKLDKARADRENQEKLEKLEKMRLERDHTDNLMKIEREQEKLKLEAEILDQEKKRFEQIQKERQSNNIAARKETFERPKSTSPDPQGNFQNRKSVALPNQNNNNLPVKMASSQSMSPRARSSTAPVSRAHPVVNSSNPPQRIAPTNPTSGSTSPTISGRKLPTPTTTRTSSTQHPILTDLLVLKSKNDYFAIFEFSPTDKVTLEEINKRRRELTRKLHPDHFQNDKESQENASKKLAKINEIYANVFRQESTLDLYMKLCEYRTEYKTLTLRDEQLLTVAATNLQKMKQSMKKNNMPVSLADEIDLVLNLLFACNNIRPS